jgi:predicted aspartyl protease
MPQSLPSRHHRLLLAVALVLTPVALLAAVGQPLLDVPLLRSNKGHAMVEIEFGPALKVECVVDTGAMSGVAPASVIDALGARAEALPSVNASGANGSITVERFRVSGLRLARLDLPPMIFVKRDLDGLSGPSGNAACVIGQPLLTPYAVELDGMQQRFRLWDAAGAVQWAVDQHAQSSAFSTPLAAFPVHDGLWGDGQIRWVLDTGAAATAINRAALAAAGLADAPALRVVERRGLDGHRVEQPVVAIVPTQLYAGLRPQTEVEVGDLPVLAALGIGADQPGGLIGADIIAGQRLLIDYQTHSLLVAAAAER